MDIYNTGQTPNSRYTPEMLVNAYTNMWWRMIDDRGVGMMNFPVNDPQSDDVEIYFRLPKEHADTLLRELFAVLYLIDAIVQEGDMDNYDITYFEVFDDSIKIGYWGTKVNTDLDAKMFRETGRWYCAEIGMQKFNPPICVSL